MTLRILIAGGFGFIGGRLAIHLEQAGHQIILGTRRSISSPSWMPQAEVVQMVWDNASSLESICKGVDLVIQAAGMNVKDCTADPVAALDFNGIATARLVAAACRARVKRFIYLSTAHVYASPLIGSINEKTCPQNSHPYATSHLAGEHAVLNSCQLGKIQGIVLRISNAFGVPTYKDASCWMLLVNDLCRQAVQTRKLNLLTSGWQQRDFIAMSEVCRMTKILAVNNDKDNELGILNIGAGVTKSVFDMAQMIQQRCLRVLGFEPELQRKQEPLENSFIPFIYQTTRLNKMEVKLDEKSNIAEIDHLLRYCDISFLRAKATTHE